MHLVQVVNVGEPNCSVNSDFTCGNELGTIT